jgi:hypothetical protein
VVGGEPRRGRGAVADPGRRLLVTTSGFGKPAIRAVRLDAPSVAWEQVKTVPMQASPVFVAPHVYVVTDAGVIVFDVDGIARTTFEANRIGLCVLHPIRTCAGRPARATHADGTVRDVPFPALVAIEQPVQGLSNLRGLAYEAGPGATIEIRLEGDTFETEDQRNCIDASFKTYSSPLSQPRPTVLAAGARVSTVTIRGRFRSGGAHNEA